MLPLSALEKHEVGEKQGLVLIIHRGVVAETDADAQTRRKFDFLRSETISLLLNKISP